MDKRRKIAEVDPAAELTAIDVVRELEELREEAEAQDAAGWGNAEYAIPIRSEITVFTQRNQTSPPILSISVSFCCFFCNLMTTQPRQCVLPS